MTKNELIGEIDYLINEETDVKNIEGGSEDPHLYVVLKYIRDLATQLD